MKKVNVCVFALLFLIGSEAFGSDFSTDVQLRTDVAIGYGPTFGIGSEVAFDYLLADVHIGWDLFDQFEVGLGVGAKWPLTPGPFISGGIGASYLPYVEYEFGCPIGLGSCTERVAEQVLVLDGLLSPGYVWEFGLFTRLNFGVRRELATKTCKSSQFQPDDWASEAERCELTFFPKIGLSVGWEF